MLTLLNINIGAIGTCAGDLSGFRSNWLVTKNTISVERVFKTTTKKSEIDVCL